MRHLVTGGAGFLGSHLCERLIARGDEVIAFDNLFTGRRENIEHILAPNFEFVRGDVCNEFHFEVDRIWHLACPASPLHYQRNPVRTIKTGVQGTLNALECARNVGARIFIASTSEVYGDPAVHPQVETYWGNANPVGPRACYDEAKRCAESLAVSYERQFGTEVRIARIFNCYGPRMQENDGRVVSSFMCQALRGQQLTIQGDGSQTRSFIYVDDLIDAFLLLMESGESTPVNLGNPIEFTISQLANAIITLVGKTGEIVYRPLPQDDPARRKPDISKATKLLNGWQPKIPLARGLMKTRDYFMCKIMEGHPQVQNTDLL